MLGDQVYVHAPVGGSESDARADFAQRQATGGAPPNAQITGVFRIGNQGDPAVAKVLGIQPYPPGSPPTQFDIWAVNFTLSPDPGAAAAEAAAHARDAAIVQQQIDAIRNPPPPPPPPAPIIPPQPGVVAITPPPQVPFGFDPITGAPNAPPPTPTPVQVPTPAMGPVGPPVVAPPSPVPPQSGVVNATPSFPPLSDPGHTTPDISSWWPAQGYIRGDSPSPTVSQWPTAVASFLDQQLVPGVPNKYLFGALAAMLVLPGLFGGGSRRHH
jgi:hypothetical protein